MPRPDVDIVSHDARLRDLEDKLAKTTLLLCQAAALIAREPALRNTAAYLGIAAGASKLQWGDGNTAHAGYMRARQWEREHPE